MTRSEEGEEACDAVSPAASGGRPWVVAVYNQKGGVGKTTTAATLATTLAACGATVLLIDLDAQGNATTAVGCAFDQTPGTYEFMTGEAPLTALWRETPFPGLRLLAASRILAGLDIELAGQPDPQFALRRALAARPVAVDYAVDYIVIDCPPALGLSPVNALVAAHAVVMPVQSETFAHDGLVSAFVSLKRIRSTFNPGLAIQGVMVTMHTPDPLSRKLDKLLREEFGEAVLHTTIPRDILVAEAAHVDLPVVVLAPRGPASLAYLDATRELLHRERTLRTQSPAMLAAAPLAVPPPVAPLVPGPTPAILNDPDAALLAASATLQIWHDRLAPARPAAAPLSPSAPLLSAEEPETPLFADAALPLSRLSSPPSSPLAGETDDGWLNSDDAFLADDKPTQHLRMVVWIAAALAMLVAAAVGYLAVTESL